MNAVMPTILLMTTLAPAQLDKADFAKLHDQLRPPAKEGWSSIPWKTSLVQACVQAAQQKKPVFMVARSGHPLGCV